MGEIGDQDLFNMPQIADSDLIDEEALLRDDIKLEDDLLGGVDDDANNAALSVASVNSSAKSISSKRYHCYVGNLHWWTTDIELEKIIAECGLNDLVEIKFFEHRSNGQSKGFCSVGFASNASVQKALTELPKHSIEDRKIVALPFYKSSVPKLEAMMSSTSTENKKKGVVRIQEAGVINMGTIRIGAPQVGVGRTMTNKSNIPSLLSTPTVPPPMGMSINSMAPSAPMMNSTLPKPFMPGQSPFMQPQINSNVQSGPPGINLPQMIPRMIMQPAMPQLQPNAMQQLSNLPPGAHVNPAVFPQFAQIVNPQMSVMRPPGSDPGGMMSAEFDNIMSRNRTVASSAISRAVSDAAAGELESAVETLLTAISLIKQSRVSGDERCKQLILNLQDTLTSIENRDETGRRRRDRSRSRSRSRDRDRRRHHRRSRSRSREHDRRRY